MAALRGGKRKSQARQPTRPQITGSDGAANFPKRTPWGRPDAGSSGDSLIAFALRTERSGGVSLAHNKIRRVHDAAPPDGVSVNDSDGDSVGGSHYESKRHCVVANPRGRRSITVLERRRGRVRTRVRTSRPRAAQTRAPGFPNQVIGARLASSPRRGADETRYRVQGGMREMTADSRGGKWPSSRSYMRPGIAKSHGDAGSNLNSHTASTTGWLSYRLGKETS